MFMCILFIIILSDRYGTRDRVIKRKISFESFGKTKHFTGKKKSKNLF